MLSVLKFLMSHWLELAGVLFSLVYLYFSINRKIWLWVIGIISSGIYAIVFFKANLYADFIQNVYYVVMSIYGLYIWLRDKEHYVKSTHEGIVCRTPKKAYISLTLSWLGLYIIIYSISKFAPNIVNISAASIPLVDSCLTSLAFVATWMLTKKYLEQWYVWIFVNFAYTFVCLYRGLYMTSGLFLIYTILAILGYRKWSTQLEEHVNCKEIKCEEQFI